MESVILTLVLSLHCLSMSTINSPPLSDIFWGCWFSTVERYMKYKTGNKLVKSTESIDQYSNRCKVIKNWNFYDVEPK